MNAILDVLMLASAVAHVIVIAYIQFNRRPARHRSGLLVVSALCSLIAAVLHFAPQLPVPRLTTGYLSALALAAAFIVYGQYIIEDIRRDPPRLWAILGVLWLLAMIGAAFIADALTVGSPNWLVTVFTALDVSGLVILLGLGITTLVLLVLEFTAFYRATLPEVVNRTLFWILTTAAFSAGVLLFISGTALLKPVGSWVLLAVLVSATYAHFSYRVFDIRGGLQIAVRTLLLLAVAVVVVYFTLLIPENIYSETADERRILLLALALGAGAIYLVLRQLVVLVFSPLFVSSTRSAVSVRHYSQQLSKAVELDDLVTVATTTLNQVMGVRRSGLMLINDTSADHNSVEVVVMQSAGSGPAKGYIAKDGPLYAQLAAERQAISQFDIDYGPRYLALADRERHFFSQLNMSAYAPIVVEDVLVGILMCGPKLNDAPFYTRDLDLLATMADQTGVALRNARSLDDLRHLNQTMRALNHELEDANLQYEKLDSVKSDFVTIASHELRTPLAQIRGYVDILDAVNEQGMLDQDQVTGMVANLRKAIERTEELIAAMLDVSQLDIKAMDLRFAQASPETILRMAIEPLTEHIKQRKLTMSARGLRGLPAIQCDMQRLVQAFRNVITNAIKFTPDGGRIDITASYQEGDAENAEHVLVAISDTGVGIDQENLELIFEKFYRAADPNLHSTGSYKFMGAGPGLGLTIARGVIESHGGKIWVESSGHNMETYPGSTFYITLPITPPDETRRVLIEDSFGDFTPARRPADL